MDDLINLKYTLGHNKRLCRASVSGCYAAIALLMVTLAGLPANAQQVPGSADPSRIEPLERPATPDRPSSTMMLPDAEEDIPVPESAKEVRFHLNRVDLEGVSAFKHSELIDLFQPYLDREITLDVIWKIAGRITKRYQKHGYFLSRAYVPAQDIDDGAVSIKVVEGYIAEVNLEDASLAEYSLIQHLTERLKNERPLSATTLESFVLQMNALPGEEFRAVVEPVEGASAGEMRLTLRSVDEEGKGLISIDNFGSRFLGPYQATATYQDSFVPLQQTTLSAFTSSPTDELKYVAFRHEAPVYPDWQVELSGNYVTAEPGSSLAANKIESDSVELGIGISWQPIRQRQENFIATLELSGKNTNSDILHNSPLTRDRIRKIKGQLAYDTADSLDGYNYLTFNVNRGIKLLGASDAGDLNLSRAEAKPDFTFSQINYTRQQLVNNYLMAVGQISGQYASGPLFSADEFGYGGQVFGRAYDPSELTGDQGLAASIKLNYINMPSWHEFAFMPYAFYDIGKVWNDDTGGLNQSASSAGLGMHLNHPSGLAAEFGLAWPLTRAISTPIYGDGKQPRLNIKLSYGF